MEVSLGSPVPSHAVDDSPHIMNEQRPPRLDPYVLLPCIEFPLSWIPIQAEALSECHSAADIDGIVGDGCYWSTQQVQYARQNCREAWCLEVFMHRTDGEIPDVSHVWPWPPTGDNLG
jgi:hypothetical protein